MKTMHLFLLWLFALWPAVYAPAQTQGDQPLFAGWAEEDRAAIEAVVMYPPDTRLAILEAATHPQLLVKIEQLQRETSRNFQDLLSDLQQEDQELIYDISRYPGLITRLATAAARNERNITTGLQDFPEVIHPRAVTAFERFGPLLQKVDDLQQTADRQVARLLSTYPEKTQKAVNTLTALPEVLSLLTENIRMTILVGDLYLSDPGRLLTQMDSLNLVMAEANSKDLEQWQKQIEGAPEAATDLQKASGEFASEYGYDDSYYAYDDMYNQEEDEAESPVVEHHYYYHYPYWFGYPHWYYYPRWRPFPLWYESGFYIIAGGRVVIHRLPSFYFTYWYFHRPYHHYYYPHLSRELVRHTYYGPRPSTSSSIAVNVRKWQERNQEVITETWLQDDRRSIDRIREYGKFATDLEKYNEKRPAKALSPTEYLERNANKYPDLYRSNEDRIRSAQTERRIVVPKTDENERVAKPKTADPPAVERERVRTIPSAPRTEPPKNVPNVKKGVENHRTTIERSKVNPPEVKPRTARPAPSKTPQKTQSAPKKVRTKEGNG